ncbi:MAG: C2H2-type zinc finger protein [Peptococcaceae bacterium]|nr:C2H2-type zinc finger protein [Peptococcaceae bacterium]
MQEKQIKCEICGKVFKNRAGLAGHMNIVHDERTKSTSKESDQLGSVRKEKTNGCQHIWKKLTPEDLRKEDESGSSIQEQGYRYYCAECGELK